MQEKKKVRQINGRKSLLERNPPFLFSLFSIETPISNVSSFQRHWKDSTVLKRKSRRKSVSVRTKEHSVSSLVSRYPTEISSIPRSSCTRTHYLDGFPIQDSTELDQIVADCVRSGITLRLSPWKSNRAD